MLAVHHQRAMPVKLSSVKTRNISSDVKKTGQTLKILALKPRPEGQVRGQH